MLYSLLLNILIFGFSLWLGCYLLARDPRKPRLRYTGLGLITFAIEIALISIVFIPGINLDGIPLSLCIGGMLHFVPALCWFATAMDFLPDDHRFRPHIGLLLILAAIGVFLSLALFQTAFFLMLVLTLIPIWFIFQEYRAARSKRTLAALIVVTIFFGLGNSFLLLPNLFPMEWVLIAIEVDLVLLGLLIAVLDTFDEGEALLPDMLYSLAVSMVMALLFGGQAAFVMLVTGSTTLPLLALLYGLVTTAIATQTFYTRIQAAIDWLVFARFARVRRERADLRAAADSLPRINDSLDLMNMEESEFSRLTRRAFSHFGDLNRLAAHPLTRLPLIDQRLSARNASDNTLERAAELKILLSESVMRLKPRDKGEAGTSDEWRYYNALYYPYVAGLKPYNYYETDGIDAETKMILDWFQTSVPERTLHNWQNAAARLIAGDLREQMGQTGSKWQ